MAPEEYKILRYVDRIQQTHTFPFFIEWHLTNSCNYNCIACIKNHYNREQEHQASIEDILSVCNQLIDNQVKAVLFSGGGEPTLVKALPSLIEMLKDENIEMALISNGYFLLDSALIQAIFPAMAWIRISVDAGTDQTYFKTKNCHYRKTFSCLLDQLSVAKKEYGIDPRIGYLITKYNYKEIDKFIFETNKRGLNNYHFRFGIPFRPEEFLSEEEVRKIMQQLSSELDADSASKVIQKLLRNRANIYGHHLCTGQKFIV